MYISFRRVIQFEMKEKKKAISLGSHTIYLLYTWITPNILYLFHMKLHMLAKKKRYNNSNLILKSPMYYWNRYKCQKCLAFQEISVLLYAHFGYIVLLMPLMPCGWWKVDDCNWNSDTPFAKCGEIKETFTVIEHIQVLDQTLLSMYVCYISS